MSSSHWPPSTLHNEEQRLFEQAPVAYLVLDADLRVLQANRKARLLLPTLCSDALHAVPLPQLYGAATEFQQELEQWLRRREEESREFAPPCSPSARHLLSKTWQDSQLLLTVTQIQAPLEHRTEDESQALKCEVVIQSTDLGFSLIDLDSKEFIATNPAYRQLFFDYGQLTNLAEIRSRMNIGRSDVEQAFERLLATRQPQVFRFGLLVNGQQRWVEAHTALLELDGQRLLQGLNRDITEEVFVQQENESLLRRLQFALRYTGLGFAVLNLRTRVFVEMSPQFQEMVFEDRTPSVADAFSRMRPNAEVVQNALAGLVDDPGPVEFRYQIELPSGKMRWVQVWAVRVAEGEQLLAHILNRDITAEVQMQQERERLLAELELEHAHIRQLLELSRSALWSANLVTNAAEFSEETYRMFQLPPNCLQTAEDFFQRVHPEDLPAVEQSLAQMLSEHTPYQAEYRFRGGEGKEFWLRAVGTLELDAEGTPTRVFGALVDMTAEKQALQAELIQLEYEAFEQRIAALGTLTANIAHELRTPLQAIQTRLELIAMLQKKERPVDFGKHFGILRGDIRQAGQILSRMLRLLPQTQGQVQQELFELQSALLEGQQKSQAAAPQESVLWDVVLCEEPIFARGVPSDFAEALRQLFDNAIKATLGKASRQLRLRLTHSESQALLVLEDNGCGMDEETRKSSVNPFFTTRPVGQGVGMGLTFAYNTIRDMNGSLQLSSEPGQGTTVTVCLPLQRAS